MADANKVYAGFYGLPRGMNSGLDPLLIQVNEFARGNNVSVRGGFAETRGGFEDEYQYGVSNFRGGMTWRLNDADRQVTVLGDTVYVYNHNTGAITTFAGIFTAGTSWCYFEQADRWMVIQSGEERPFVMFVDNAGTPQIYGRNAPQVCLTISTIMKYLHQRIFMVPVIVPQLTPDYTLFPAVVPDDSAPPEPGQMAFCAADVRDNYNPEYLFRMTEHRVVAQGGVLTLPAEFGFIEGMGMLRGAATGTGVGTLVVFGREGVSVFDVMIPRSQWLTTNIGQVLFQGAGTRSRLGIVSVNDDLVYLDTDGNIRFLQYDKADLSGGSGALHNVPKSHEMEYWITQGDPLYLGNASAAFVNNRLFWSLIGESDGTYKAVGALDVIPSYTMSARDNPAYYGVWTGFKFLQVVSARKNQKYELFCYVQDASGKVHLLRYNEDAITDPNDTPITSTIVTGVYSFATERVATATDIKQIDYADLWLGNIKRNTLVSVYYRPHGYPVWTLMGSKDISVPGGPAQNRRDVRISLDRSAVGCDNVTQKPLNISDRFQFMIRWTGWCRIEMFRPVGIKVTEEDPDVCEVDNENLVEQPVDTLDPDFDYQVTL